MCPTPSAASASSQLFASQNADNGTEAEDGDRNEPKQSQKTEAILSLLSGFGASSTCRMAIGTSLSDIKPISTSNNSNQPYPPASDSSSSGGSLMFSFSEPRLGEKETVLSTDYSNQPPSIVSLSSGANLKFDSLGTSVSDTKIAPTFGASNQMFSVASGPPSLGGSLSP